MTLSAIGANDILPKLGVPVVFATIIMDIIILIIAEMTPKTYALSNPTLNSMKASGSLEVIALILKPVVWLLTYFPSRLINMETIFHTGSGKLITEKQLVHMIGQGAIEGTIEQKESERAVKVFKFGDTDVERVMIPWADVVHLTVGDTVREALKVANESGYSRLPVLTADGSDSPGFLTAKDLLRLSHEGKLEEPVDNYLRPIQFIPENKRILDLLQEFRTGHEQIGLVINEFGTLTGVVTLEDLLEEVLGEIYDEYDVDEPEAKWVQGTLVAPGSYPAHKLGEMLKVELPQGEYDTVAGLFLELMDGFRRRGNREN